MDFLRAIQLAHIYYFSLTTLKNILQKVGFKLISRNEDIHAIFKYTGEKSKNFKSDYKNIINYLNQKEKQRTKFFPNYYVFKQRIIITIEYLAAKLNLLYFIREKHQQLKTNISFIKYKKL